MTEANKVQIGGDHYQREEFVCDCGRRHQHWDIAWALKWDSFMYPITKYLWRWRRKNRLEDLRKAKHYLEKYIQVLEKEEGVTQMDADDMQWGSLTVPAENIVYGPLEPGYSYVCQDPDDHAKRR